MKKIHSKHYSILLIGVAYSAFIAGTIASHAQSASDTQQNAQTSDTTQAKKAAGSVELQPIIISAGVDMDAPYLTPGGVSVIDGNIVQEKYGGDANAIVRSMPGTFTRISSSQPGVAVNIRGFESDGRVNTMIDGVPQMFRNTAGHASTGGELLYMDTNLLAGVGAERGAVNGAHGMGSLAGAVNFRTIDFDDVVLEGQDQGVKTIMKAGNNGYGLSGMIAGGARTNIPGSGMASIVGAFSYSDHENYRRGDGVYNTPDASNKPGSGLLKFRFQPDDVMI
ncbi:TonB-dependent receptor plug domain-containing protein [Ochrobactrum quorumnocens]|uniref:TonB-dependent receptor plug domain-containing protein n=1 Tax=Ochrobactrum quorumnocens TaxID=271865 RepID=UPI003BA2E1EB